MAFAKTAPVEPATASPHGGIGAAMVEFEVQDVFLVNFPQILNSRQAC